MLRLTRAAGSPYTVLHRSRETHNAMTVAVATPRADPASTPALARTAAAGLCAPTAASPLPNAHARPTTLRFATDAASQPVDMPLPHTSSAGTA
jgi:hypothetical protein